MRALERGGVAGVALLAFLGAAAGYGSQILIARVAGPDGFGVYSFVLGLSAMAQPWLALDFGAAIVRFVPAYASLGQFGNIRRMIGRSGQVVFLTTSLTALGLLATLRWRTLEGVSTAALWLGLVTASLNVDLQLTGQFLTAMRRAALTTLLAQVIRPFLVVGLVLVFQDSTLFRTAPELIGLVASIGGLLLVLAVARTILDQSVKPSSHEFDLGDRPATASEIDWFRYAGTFLLGSVAQTLISQQVDVVIVGALVTKTDAGHYAAAGQLAVAMGIVPGVVNSILAPRYASAHDSGDEPRREQTIQLFAVLLIGISLVGLLGIWLAGPLFLSLYGQSFGEARTISLLLSGAVALSTILGMPASLILSTRGHHKIQNIALVVSALFAVSASIFLTNRLGPVGAAWATVATAAFRGITLQTLCRRLQQGALSYRSALRAALRDPSSVLTEVIPFIKRSRPA